MPTIRLQLPRPHSSQRQVISQSFRYNVVVCGRRWGKTTLGIDRLIGPALKGRPVAWFAPSYRMLTEAWRSATRILRPVVSRPSEQEHRLELVTGGLVEMWSLDTPDVARGRKYARAVIDEAGIVSRLQEAWLEVIRPTLADLAGDAWFLSTPKGLNYFHTLYQLGVGKEPGWHSWQRPTADNPYIPSGEIEALQKELPERVYSQEILAQFVDDAGGVFRHIMEAATAERREKAEDGHPYAFGVDWGKSNDFTVITVLDLARKAVVCADRFNQIDWAVQVGRLKALYQRFNPTVIIAESNSMGGPLVEQLQRDNLPVTAFQTTNATKAAAIEALSLAFEQGEISIPNDPVLIGELMAYDMERLPSGMIRYSAPEGAHDDCVMSLALAWQAAAHELAGQLFF